MHSPCVHRPTAAPAWFSVSGAPRRSHYTTQLGPLSNQPTAAPSFEGLIASPEDTRAYLRLAVGERRNEAFGCLFLDNRHRIRAVEELLQGAIDGGTIHPREVLVAVLRHNAAAVVPFRNHPSGVAEPSDADEVITRRPREVLSLIDVRVLDRIVVTTQENISFAQRGLIGSRRA